jgi:thymidine kinase
LAWADELIEIKTICHTGKKATMNARIDALGNRIWEGEQIEIGTNYVSLSRKEFQLERVSPVAEQTTAKAARTD